MSITVKVASTDQDLTTTDQVKYSLGITDATNDAQISALIRAAGRWSESYVGYPVRGIQTYRETLAGYGRTSLMLSRTPIVAINAVYDATDTGTANLLKSSSDYRIEDAEAGILTQSGAYWGWTVTLQPPGSFGPFMSAIPLEAAPMPGQEYRPWLVEYVAGWTYNGLDTGSANWSTGLGATTSTGRTFPEDFEQAIIYKAQAFYEGQDETQSEKLGDLEVNYSSLGTDPQTGRLLTKSDAILMPYQRVAG